MYIFMILTFTVKEDAAIYIAFIALYFILSGRKKLHGFVMFFSSVIYFTFAVTILKKFGETAMEKIYISWEDSVKNAAERYKTVLENYRAGKYKKEDTLAGEWLETEGEFLNYISKGKDRYSKAAKKLYRKRIKLKKKIIEKSKDIFDSIL